MQTDARYASGVLLVNTKGGERAWLAGLRRNDGWVGEVGDAE